VSLSGEKVAENVVSFAGTANVVALPGLKVIVALAPTTEAFHETWTPAAVMLT
jgi:hypothetical protein